MGINKNTLKIELLTLMKNGMSYKGIKVCQLGNQRFTFVRKSGGEHYIEQGAKEVLSIDLNSRDGSLPLDLDKSLPEKYDNNYDLITNYGTIEHVNNQYEVFKNVHKICNLKGIMIHIMPMKGYMEGHCRFYYTALFMENLCNACGYEKINASEYDDSIYNSGEKTKPEFVVLGIFRKIKNNSFISENEFKKLKGIYDTGTLEYTGDYDTKTHNFIKKVRYLSFESLKHPIEFLDKFSNNTYKKEIKKIKKNYLATPIKK